jgi:hypothetical protein
MSDHLVILFSVAALQRDLVSFSAPFAEALRSTSQPLCSSSSAAQATTAADVVTAVGSNTASDGNDVLQLLEIAVTARQEVHRSFTLISARL